MTDEIRTGDEEQERPDEAPSAGEGAELRRVRREAAELRARLRRAEEEMEAFQAAGRAEGEQLRQQVGDLQARLAAREEAYREQGARHAVERAARELGIADADAAWKLLDRAALRLDEAGRPTNAAEALEALLREHPVLASGPYRGPGPANPPRAAGAPALSRQALARMSADEINAHWDVLSVQLSGKQLQ